MEIDNDLINDILKIAYKAVPKKCSLDGNKLIEVHDEMREFLKIKLLKQAHVSGQVCDHKHSLEKGYEMCDECNKWLV